MKFLFFWISNCWALPLFNGASPSPQRTFLRAIFIFLVARNARGDGVRCILRAVKV